ncbi:helix-turn-helix domain-containing protein [bacterium]|nr:helix-turn-helix domain-containing protein [bacterium]
MSDQTTVLHIKNMVCNRCVRVVKEELQKLGVEVQNVTLGEAVIIEKSGNPDRESIRKKLIENGFDLVDDKRSKTIEKIKNAIIALVHHNEDKEEMTGNYSDYIVQAVNADYHYLSNLFSSIEGITIEKYIIQQKIERVKELLKYDELTLSEIAYKMGYSSVAHLSNQFKKVTGLSASEYKRLKEQERKPLDEVGKQ